MRATFGVGAANARRNRRVASVPASEPPSFRVQPALSGVPTVGSSVGFSTGEFGGSLPIEATTRLLLDAVEVGQLNAQTYTPVTADVGKTLAVRVSLTNSTNPGAPVVATSPGVVVQAAPVDPGPGVGSAALTWSAPGVAGITGYVVYWSRNVGGTDNSIAVNALAHTVGSLSAGTWYFGVAASASGVIGPPTPAGTKTFA